MGRTIRTGLAVIGLVLLCLVIVVFTVDLGRFKPLILDFASDYLERTIEIDGPLSIEIGSKVRVSGESVRVASEEWTEDPELVSVERFAIAMDTWSLLTGVALFDEAEASGIKANLAMNEDGENNWTFAGLEDEDEDDETATPVVIRRAEIADAEIRYSMPELPSISLAVSRLDVNERPDQGLNFELGGNFNEATLRATGELGTVAELIEGKNVPFQITGELGEITIAASGMIDDLYEPGQPEIEVALEGPNAEYLTGILGIEPVTTGPFSFHASTGEAEGALAVNVDGTYGEFDLDLSGQLADLQTLDDLNLNAHAEGPSIGTVARLAGQADVPDLPFSVDTRIQLSGQSLDVQEFLFDLGAATVEASASLPNFPGLDGAQANVVAAGSQFGDFTGLMGLPGKLTGPFEATLTLDRTASGSALNARLEADALQASAIGELTDDSELVGSTVSVRVGGDDAALIAAAFEAEGVPSAPFAAAADLIIGDAAIDIANGMASLADVAVGISGSLGQDPFSAATRLRFDTEIANLAATMTELGFDAEGLPAEALALDVAINGADGAILIEPLVARLGDIESLVDARIGESFTLTDITAEFEVSGASLSGLLPMDEMPLADESFRVTGRLSFAGEDTLQVDDLEAEYGPASARLAISLSLVDPLAAGQIRIEAESASLRDIVPAASEYVGEDDAFSIVGGGRWEEDGLWLEDTTIRVGEINVDVKGELHAPPEIAGTALTLNASLPSLKILEMAAGQPLPDEPLTIRADVVAEADTFRLSTFDLKLGQSDLSGTAAFRPADGPEDVPELTAELSSSLLDLRPLQALLAEDSQEQEPEAEPEDGRLIPDMPVTLEPLREVNGDLLLTVDRVLLNNTTVSGILFDGQVADGALLIERFALGGPAGGEISGSLKLTPNPSGSEFSLTADGDNLIVGLPAKTDEAIQALPRYEFNTRLAASGLTVREMAASSQGYLRLVADEGRVDLGPITAVMGDFVGEVFDAVNPFAKKETDSLVQCMAVLVEVNDGVVNGKPAVVLQTDKLNIVGTGRVDLSSEKLSAKFNSQARKGIGIGISDLVSPLTEVGGTLASPALQLNATGAIVEGGAAVATVGISFLAKKARDRIFADKEPCRTAIAEADKDLAEGGVPLSEPIR
jgi:uncharacterized protein involved in outer membrane biogenesis